jgi:hypothetical protein
MTTETPDGLGWLEPESAANTDYQPQYPYNKITQTESGHSFELDDTPERERVKLLHRTGTFIEMHPNGDEVHKVYGDGYEITIKNKNVLIKGSCNITIEGDSTTEIKGNKNEVVRGDYNLVVNGNLNIQGRQAIDIGSQEVTRITSDPTFGGYLDLNAGGEIHVKGDMIIEGVLRATDIFSDTSVSAKLGVHAGINGFVSLTGGIAIGIPAAFPGTINCIGTMNASVSMNSPIGSFNYMSATLMTDDINTSLYAAHIHPTPKGPSGSPRPKMI